MSEITICEACRLPGLCRLWGRSCDATPAERLARARALASPDPIGPTPPPAGPEPVEAPPPTNLQQADPDRQLPVDEAVRLLNIAKGCQFRSTSPGCGCSGAACGLRNGGIVSHRDCIACASKYGES